jgi:hypothetical protein
MNRRYKDILSCCLAFSCFILLQGCSGYHFGNGALTERYHTITVPYAEGDFDGSFTTELIKQIAISGVFEYTRTGSDLLLKIRLIDFEDENIGFRYYRNKDDVLTRETIPVETRLSVTAEVSLMDRSTGKEVLPTVRISASTDFDHDYYSTKEAINVTSLGQLTDYDEALDAAEKPLYFNLSKKIVDYVSDAW